MSIGDAAWSLDPLSGNGIERAVSDGIDAATAISQALISGDSGPLRSHAVSRANSFRESLAVQRQYYSVEKRWGDNVFWRRRV
jgi:flavin-dependent dehydrogenase